jgi:transposase
MLQPLWRRTWAPRGCTPVVYQRDRRDRLSNISAICVSPTRHRLSLYFRTHPRNIRSEQVIEFLRVLFCQIPKGMLLVWDGGGIHKSRAVRHFLSGYAQWVQLQWLPGYAPDLNPVEHLWGHTKNGELANFTPDTLRELRTSVRRAIAHTRHTPQLLRSFFELCQLRL